jgi:hypothetical protein
MQVQQDPQDCKVLLVQQEQVYKELLVILEFPVHLAQLEMLDLLVLKVHKDHRAHKVL